MYDTFRMPIELFFQHLLSGHTLRHGLAADRGSTSIFPLYFLWRTGASSIGRFVFSNRLSISGSIIFSFTADYPVLIESTTKDG